jgi:hypothetical protein
MRFVNGNLAIKGVLPVWLRTSIIDRSKVRENARNEQYICGCANWETRWGDLI